ncbi:MAG TPA: ATP-binding protein [Solirubrobacterales bacterium]|nr:ATP-binding protein [Solirubrobacterales bacterium]
MDVTPRRAKVNLPYAADLDGQLHYGDRPGGGDVGEFLALDAGDVAVLGRLTDVRLPERERLSVEPKMGTSLPVHPIGNIQLLTSVPLDGSSVERGVTRFPQIGARVYSLDPKLVAWIVERVSDTEPGESALLLDLAYMPGTAEARVRITPEKLFGRHCAVLGATGSGKSWTLARIAERVSQFQAKVILLDPTGEYHALSDRVTHVSIGGVDKPNDCSEVTFPHTYLEEQDLFALFQPSVKAQVPKLREAIKSLKLAQILDDSHPLVDAGCIPKEEQAKAPFFDAYGANASDLEKQEAAFDITKLVRQIALECVWPSAEYGRDPSRWGQAQDNDLSMCTTLIARIEGDVSSAEFAPIFRPGETKSLVQAIEDFLADDDAAVLRISLRDLPFDRNVREIVANGLGRHLLRLARTGRFQELPVVVCVDEAHQFLSKELGDEFGRYALDAFELVAKEGRKYGLSICLATQRPRDIPGGVLGQMGTLLVHRLTNERDREMVERAAGELDRAEAEFLPNLVPGQALLLGVDFPIPLTIQVTPPTVKPDSKGPDFQKHWKRKGEDVGSASEVPTGTGA